MPEGHRNRPYIVVGKNETSLIAYLSSHKPPKRNHSWQTFKLFHTRNEAYYRYDKLKKNYLDSYYSLKRYYELTPDRLHYLFMQPVKGEAERLERQLHILHNHGKKVFKMGLKIPFRDGDLIEHEGKPYFIYTVDGENLYTHPVVKKEDFLESIAVEFGFGHRCIDWRVQKLFKTRDCSSLIDATTFEALKAFERVKKSKKSAQKIESKANSKMEVYYKFPLGQVFYLSYADEEVIYLCHAKKRAYAVFCRDIRKGQPEVRCFDELNYAKKLDKVFPSEGLLELLNDLLETDNFQGLKQIQSEVLNSLEKA